MSLPLREFSITINNLYVDMWFSHIWEKVFAEVPLLIHGSALLNSWKYVFVDCSYSYDTLYVVLYKCMYIYNYIGIIGIAITYYQLIGQAASSSIVT